MHRPRLSSHKAGEDDSPPKPLPSPVNKKEREREGERGGKQLHLCVPMFLCVSVPVLCVYLLATNSSIGKLLVTGGVWMTIYS